MANVAAIIAALVVAVAFFLPWMQGSNEFEYRSFSGFDFARLVRNFEITAGSPSGLGQMRATAIALYLVPALAVNAAVFNGLTPGNQRPGRAAGMVSLIASVYALGVLGGVLFLSMVPVSPLAGVIGRPGYGVAATAAASLIMLVSGARMMLATIPGRIADAGEPDRPAEDIAPAR